MLFEYYIWITMKWCMHKKYFGEERDAHPHNDQEGLKKISAFLNGTDEKTEHCQAQMIYGPCTQSSDAFDA